MSAAPVYSSSDPPFPMAAGRGVKIAVIDSGVNGKHPHIRNRISRITIHDESTDGARFAPGELVAELSDDTDDKLGHGTAVMAAIQEKAPEAEYYAVKLFHESLSSTSVRLMRAIRWAIDHDMHLVNMSLGTPNMDYRSEFMALVEYAKDAGVILVCAKQEGDRPVLPGMLEGVVGVDVDWRLPRNAYRIDLNSETPTYFASGFPRPLPGISPIRNLSGISFAVANMTGLLARACEHVGARSLRTIQEALLEEGERLQA